MFRSAIISFLLLSSTIYSEEKSYHYPQKAKETVSVVPIKRLISISPPTGGVWIQGTIEEVIDADTFIIQDNTAKIILFLPDQSLTLIKLDPQMEVLAFGKVDISTVSPKKNEFYAEKILLTNK
jgi:uncharacterized protein YdeI (BOF family)